MRVSEAGWEHNVFIHARYTSSFTACEDSNSRGVGWAGVHMFPRCLFVRRVRYRRIAVRRAAAASAEVPPPPGCFFYFQGLSALSHLSWRHWQTGSPAWQRLLEASSLKEAICKINTSTRFQDAKPSAALQVFCVNFVFFFLFFNAASTYNVSRKFRFQSGLRYDPATLVPGNDKWQCQSSLKNGNRFTAMGLTSLFVFTLFLAERNAR